VAHADHRGGLGEPIDDRRLAGVGEGRAALAQSLAPAGEDGLAPVVVRAAIAEGPVVGGREAILEGDLGDDLRPPVVGVQLLERAVGIAPADAAGAEDLVQPLDDGWRLGRFWYVGFDITCAIIRDFRLPLYQEVSSITIPFPFEQNLGILTPRFGCWYTLGV
jgi:hypothetical protein